MTRHTRASAARVNSTSAESRNPQIAKIRRSHKKSRNGCIECKKRHIRCDERRPSCANCHIAERTCVFSRPLVGKHMQISGQENSEQQKQRPRETMTLSSVSEPRSQSNMINMNDTSTPSLPIPQEKNHSEFDQTLIKPSITGLHTGTHDNRSSAFSMQLDQVHIPPINSHPNFPNFSDAVSSAIYTPHHMILLRHADAVPNFTGPNCSIVNIAVQYAVDSPYLLDEILAFTAFHMAHIYPGSAMCLRNFATELQIRALASFSRLTEMVPKDDEATAVPRFLFSAILGRHSLAENLVYYSSGFHSLVNRFVECFNLNRGVRAITPPARDFLHNSEVQPFMNVVLLAQSGITSPGKECGPLFSLVNSSDLSEASVEACRQATHVLQLSFDTFRNLDEKDFAQATSVFTVGISGSFVDVLRKLQPEALVILAYFGVLLHLCRDYWAFGNAGASIVRTIADHLGIYWQEALAWPLHVIETRSNPRTLDVAP
ncbi:hypothetical protein DM02DRAFT_704298 [Periconia macrospinosa]|uniref:Zn(2)-C6 fungal-type domain-containing protein n=1 Tax=Periconia macrospinosa TaxID=97972 RepID=A0A2V1DWN1_9PLEO|nr:hypothetical protein DM02DRAFT_704298 [Periconia macrospinosa]